MDDDRDLRDFSHVGRLFPLPNVVLFPHAVLPLHVFEPRYRQMTEDALAGDKLITMVQTRAAVGAGGGEPPVESVGCLGRILQHERLPDGRFNFLLLGRKRVRLTREIPSGKAYRVAEVEILHDVTGGDDDTPRRDELIGLFRRAFESRQPIDPDLDAILVNSLPMGVLTDILAHALGLPPEIKQGLLAEPLVALRAQTLGTILRQLIRHAPDAAAGSRPFPPPFSAN